MEEDESGTSLIKITEQSGSYDFASVIFEPQITGEEERLIMFEQNLS